MTAPGDLDTILLARVRERLSDSASTITAENIADAIRAEAKGMLGDADILQALRLLESELLGAGPLDSLLAHPTVSDVLVTSPHEVWADRGEGLRRTEVRFADEDSVRRLAQRLAFNAGRRLDQAQPWVDGWLSLGDLNTQPGGARNQAEATADSQLGVRLHAILAPIATAGTCISLRVLRPASHSLSQLAATQSLPPHILPVLHAIVRARLAFLVVGGTGSGKTTLLSALLAAVDPRERIVCVEDAAELAPPHPHVVRLVARTANVEGAGAITVRDLVRQALRMRPDRVVIGEVRGPEVIDLLTALNTGHDGGAGTVHAKAPQEVPARLEALAAMGGMEPGALHSQLAAAVQVVIHVTRTSAGTRVLHEIAVVATNPSGRVTVVPAWNRSSDCGPGWQHLEALLAVRGVTVETS